MTLYQVANGHDNTAGYSTLDPQPRCEGIRFLRRVVVISGKVFKDGAHAFLVFNELRVTEFTGLLTAFGVSTTDTNTITVTLPGDDRTLDDYNATVVRPYPPYRSGLFRGDIAFLVKFLEAIT